ncbi:cytochrome c [Thermoflavifilum aggregans]|uniref:Cytochrome c n=1 Tax=Thermoflavifilum aggregans TaxID=454188 RepID=A0A2M9CXI2_9BACT|nr:cytochrome c [Thermoflavifilum aggregans]PJJ76622.1 cytochrome c [Thermoflavifilum aggregans]
MKKILWTGTTAVLLGLLAACGSNSSNQSAGTSSPVSNASSATTATSPSASTASSAGSAVEKGQELFQANCSACHRIHEKLIGPPLAGVTKIRSKQWLYNWIRNSQAVINSGDTAAINLYKEYNQVQMTPFPQLSNEDIDNILAYIDAQSGQQ